VCYAMPKLPSLGTCVRSETTTKTETHHENVSRVKYYYNHLQYHASGHPRFMILNIIVHLKVIALYFFLLLSPAAQPLSMNRSRVPWLWSLQFLSSFSLEIRLGLSFLLRHMFQLCAFHVEVLLCFFQFRVFSFSFCSANRFSSISLINLNCRSTFCLLSVDTCRVNSANCHCCFFLSLDAAAECRFRSARTVFRSSSSFNSTVAPPPVSMVFSASPGFTPTCRSNLRGPRAYAGTISGGSAMTGVICLI